MRVKTRFNWNQMKQGRGGWVNIDETTGGDRSIDGDSSTVAPFQGIATSLSSSYNEWLEDWIDDEDPVRQKIPFGLAKTACKMVLLNDCCSSKLCVKLRFWRLRADSLRSN